MTAASFSTESAVRPCRNTWPAPVGAMAVDMYFVAQTTPPSFMTREIPWQR